VPRAAACHGSAAEAQAGHPQAEYQQALREKVFGGWPAESGAPKVELKELVGRSGIRVGAYDVESQPAVNLRLWVLQAPRVKRPDQVVLTVLDAESWTNSPVQWLWLGGEAPEACARLRQEMQAGKLALAFFAPREVEPAKWQADPKTANQIRRRYMLLGQTLEGMRVWDIRRAAQAVKALPEFKLSPLCVCAKRQMGVNTAYAALFEPAIEKLELEGLPASQLEGPDYLNVLKVGDIPQVLELLGQRVEAPAHN